MAEHSRTSIVVINAQNEIIEMVMCHDNLTLIVGDQWSSDVAGMIEVEIETVVLSDRTLKLIRSKPTDALTGAQSREQFDRDFKRLYEQPDRDFALAMCDINRLKRVNDRDGHLAGDALLKRFVENVQVNLRQYDSVYRFGGDEFAIIFRHIRDASLLAVLEARLRDVTQTMSACGLAHASEATSANALIALADARLYEDKRDYS